MIRVILLTATLAFVAVASPCDAQSRALDPKRLTVTVHVFKAGLFRAFADDHVIEAPLAEGSLDDSATPAAHISIDVRGMRVLDPSHSPKDRGEVQTRMLGPDVLDGDLVPAHSFSGRGIPAGGCRSLVRPRRVRTARSDPSSHGQRYSRAGSLQRIDVAETERLWDHAHQHCWRCSQGEGRNQN